MNKSMATGLLASVVVLIYAVTGAKNMGVFLDTHAIVIVFGGTIAATFVCFPIAKVLQLISVFVRRLRGHGRDNYIEIIEEIVALSIAYKRGNEAFNGQIADTKDLFLKDAGGILAWIDADIPPEKLRELLEVRVETHFEQYIEQADKFKTMAKFPPAFGLMGTTLAMITLLQSMGGDDMAKMIGPAMAIGLVATFYGIAITNFLLIPIAENLTKQSKEDLLSRRLVVEGIMLIQEGVPTEFVKEKVRSYLLPSQRGDGNGANVIDQLASAKSKKSA